MRTEMGQNGPLGPIRVRTERADFRERSDPTSVEKWSISSDVRSSVRTDWSGRTDVVDVNMAECHQHQVKFENLGFATRFVG